MAHMIDFSNGRANMAYVGETPWHGLGFKLPAGATVDDMTIAAGLTYDVVRAPMQYVVDNEVLEVGNRAVLYRNDTKAPLGFVAPGYKIVQPRDVMDLFRTVCAKSGFEMETAGCLAGGSRVWALAKMTDGAYVVDKDEVHPYLLMATSFDGTLATTAKLTAVRVVCQNTLSLSTEQDAGADEKNTVKVYHSQAWDQDAALEQLGVYTSSWQKFMINTKRLAERTLTREEMDAIICTTFSKPVEGEKADNFRKGPVYQNVTKLFDSASIGNDGSGTAWQLLNAVTEQIDHHAGRSVDTRLNSAWFGQGNTVKTKAYKALEALVA